MISVVSPVYQSSQCLDELLKVLSTQLSMCSIEFEVILINDGSTDSSWEKITQHAQKDTRIKGVNLSRNFGQHAAITAGLEIASGDWIVVMDCDLQDSPYEIAYLLNKAKEGYDIVLAQRLHRTDAWHKRLSSFLFYSILSFLTGIQQDHTIANFGIYHRKVIQSILKMRESIRFFPAMINWIGFKKIAIPVQHQYRLEGKSSYTFKKRCKLALDIVLAYSNKPLKLIVYLGFTISGISISFAIIIFIRALQGKIEMLGYASLIIGNSFLSGIIISVLGIIGLYTGKIFEGIKNRPLYLIRETTYASNPIQQTLRPTKQLHIHQRGDS